MFILFPYEESKDTLSLLVPQYTSSKYADFQLQIQYFQSLILLPLSPIVTQGFLLIANLNTMFGSNGKVYQTTGEMYRGNM